MQRNVLVSRILLALAVVSILALIIFGALFIRSRFFGSGQATLGNTANIPQEAKVLPFSGGFVYASEQKLHCIDKNGKEEWAVDLKSDDIRLCAGTNRVALYQEEELKVFAKNGTEAYTKPLNMVASQVVYGTERVALLSESREIIYVLNNVGSRIDTIDLTGQTIVDFGFYSSKELLWVISLDTAGSQPVSVVSIYEPEQSTIAMHKFTEEIVYKLIVGAQSTKAYAIGTQSISTMDLQSGTLGSNSVLIYGYQYVGSFQNTIVLAPTEQWEAGAVSQVKVVKDGKATDFLLPSTCQAFAVTDKYLYAANPAVVYTLSHARTKS